MEGLGLNLGYVLVQIISFLVMVVILRAWAYKPILKMLEDRRNRIAQGLEDARVAADARANAEKEAEEVLTTAQQEAAAKVREATERAEEAMREIRAEAEKDAAEIREIADFIAVLHRATWGPPDRAMQNPQMRALNHTHVFELPLARDNGVDLEVHEPGLTGAARALADDDQAKRAFGETARRYLGDGPGDPPW